MYIQKIMFMEKEHILMTRKKRERGREAVRWQKPEMKPGPPRSEAEPCMHLLLEGRKIVSHSLLNCKNSTWTVQSRTGQTWNCKFCVVICHLVTQFSLSLSNQSSVPSRSGFKIHRAAQARFKLFGITKQWESSKENRWPGIEKQTEAPAGILTFQVCLAKVMLLATWTPEMHCPSSPAFHNQASLTWFFKTAMLSPQPLPTMDPIWLLLPEATQARMTSVCFSAWS